MAEEVLVIFCTFPDKETARGVGRTLVEEGLAACVNVLPGVESIYRWKGVVETGGEVMAIIKSTVWRYQMLEARLLALHPYEMPEVLGIKVEVGSVEYLRWVESGGAG
jgi:periplasmic divalent cation tolerance protein